MLNCPKICKPSCSFNASLQPEIIVFTPKTSQFEISPPEISQNEYPPTTPNKETFVRIKPIHESSYEKCPSTQSCKSNDTKSYDDNSERLSFNGSFEGKHITFLP